MKKLNTADFDKLCKLAHIRLNQEKSEQLMNDCNQLLEHIERLNIVNTDNIDADFRLPDHGPLPLNEDLIEHCFSVEEALSNAPSSQENYFWVPDVIDSKKQGDAS
ncbi:MAG TPA: Asp-tRNA(Asn)/Glu-tRNA(Gln) amidotransferase subunit GatC [Oligoflexia bacterium]|nr:Asp-tRNA(Asn)/Glu-tRNA(Gln) amidotransferase subunit GatC [Oligoflexia bacterium]HMR25423.1 Asp-tRNA(Asn)/Glu-tRNA(Gln) amidotransferase subunit GatC [Oligoflexia bacterium]